VDYLAQPVVFFFTLWIAGILWWINGQKQWKTCASSVPNYRSNKVTRGNILGFTFAILLTDNIEVTWNAKEGKHDCRKNTIGFLRR
jgi:hypothetical protein